MWCIAEITDEYRKRMMDILKIYEKSYDPLYPVICFDEKSKQLLDDIRRPIQAKAGKIRKVDYEYKRNGTANIFVAVEPKGKFRTVRTTERRTKTDFAKEIKRITQLSRYDNAKKIHIILDNLNTHFEKSFYETFSQTEAQKILQRIKFHYTPKHASWLNMAEIEINVLSGQCLGRHIAALKDLRKQTSVWTKHRNKKNIGIKWRFTRIKAEAKFKITQKLSK